MSTLLEKIEKELKLPREYLKEEELGKFMEIELKNKVLEIAKLAQKYGVNSFDELWEQIEAGRISESQCFDDLTRLEYLEIEKEKIQRLIEEERHEHS
ncbi:MAG: hypothetical protein AB1393_00010 [Candidatus Edwardsbacteria bacterium]